MAGDNLSNITSALSQTFGSRLVRQWNRQAILGSVLQAENELGQGDAKQVAWDVEFSGAAAASFAEGSDVQNTEYNQDPIVPATLAWGQYRAPFQLTNLEIAAAQRNMAGPAVLGRIVEERLFGSIAKLMATINADIISGTGTDGSGNPTIVGLTTALTATGTYANIAKGTYSEWAGNALSNGGTPRALTFDLLATGEQQIFTASGMEPDILVGSPGVVRKYESLFEVGRRIVNEGSSPTQAYYGSTSAGATGPRTNLFWRGKPVIRDKNMPAGTLFMLNTSEVFVKPLPMAPSPDGVSQTATNLPSTTGNQSTPTSFQCTVYPLARTGSAVKFAAEIYLQLKVARVNAHAYFSDLQET